MGISVLPVRAEGLAASQGATDFGEYFLYFSFFLVVSALLLAALFFKLGVEQRLREIGLLQAIGFPAKKIRTLFLTEGALLAIAGSVLGLAGAIGYAYLLMLGLRTWWVDAVGTTMLKLHISPQSLLIGALGGTIAAIVCIVWTLKRLRPRVFAKSVVRHNKLGSSHKERALVEADQVLRRSCPHDSWNSSLIRRGISTHWPTARLLRRRNHAAGGAFVLPVGLVATVAQQDRLREVESGPSFDWGLGMRLTDRGAACFASR